MGMRTDRVEVYEHGSGAPEVAWSRPKKLLGVLAGAVLLLALAVGVWGDTTSSAQTSRAAAPSECRSIGGPISYGDQSGLLATFRMSQTICWNYQELTYVSQPRVSGEVTKLGASKGWRYDGLIRRSDRYFAYKGVSDGGHKSIRQGSFSVCSGGGSGESCVQVKTPRIKIFGFYDRGGYQVRNP